MREKERDKEREREREREREGGGVVGGWSGRGGKPITVAIILKR